MGNYCKALGKIREALALLKDDPGSRELVLAITKLDEAKLWRQRDMQLKASPINETEFTNKKSVCDCKK